MDDTQAAKQICKQMRRVLYQDFSYITNPLPDVQFSFCLNDFHFMNATYVAAGDYPDKIVADRHKVTLVLHNGMQQTLIDTKWIIDILNVDVTCIEPLSPEIAQHVEIARQAYKKRFPKQKTHAK